MKVLLLTGDQPRHRALAARLAARGLRVLAWAEPKGAPLNEPAFAEPGAERLLALHRRALARALDAAGLAAAPAAGEPPLEWEPVARGALAGEALLEPARAFAPDLVLTYGCGIVGAPLLAAFPGRVVGSHQGLPQHFRGSGSNFFAFLEGEAGRMGLSVHLVDEGIDTGPVLAQVAPSPEPGETYYAFSARLVACTLDLLVEVAAGATGAALRGAPLPRPGRLYQRRDFTPAALERALDMQLQRSFRAWHRDSRAALGAPELLGAPWGS